MGDSPRVLIVLPLYNAMLYVEQAIESILCQTLSDYELLIVNDGSTDGSDAVARSFCDRRIKVLDQKNLGPSLVMNRALAYAVESGVQYIARMDADDISLPDRLEKQISFLDQMSDVAACGANSYYFEVDSEEIIGTSTVPRSSSVIKWEIQNGMRGLIQGTCVFRTNALAEIGGYRAKFIYAEDTDLFLRLSEKFELANITKFLYKIRLHKNSLSLRSVRESALYHYYALNCFSRRRRHEPEISFSEFNRNNGWWTRYLLWREEQMLQMWRYSMSANNKLFMLFAALLDPRRAVARLLKWVLH